MINFDKFILDLDKAFVQTYSIASATEMPPTKSDKSFIWTFNSLVRVIRPRSEGSDFYGLKNHDLFTETLFLLNEGYLNFRISDFDYKELGVYKDDVLENLNHNQHAYDMYKHIWATFRYSNHIDMAFAIWEEHANKGENDIKFSNRNISVYVENAKIAYKFGDTAIKPFLRAFEQGVKEFNIVDTYNGECKMYTFYPTPKYAAYLIETTKRNKELKKTFSQIKGKYKAELDTYNNENLSKGDLVEFIYEGEAIRGYIYQKSKEVKDFDTLQREINTPLRQMNHDLIAIQGLRKPDCTLFFDDTQFDQSEYIIKALKVTARTELHNYYAVNREQVAYKLNEISVSDIILEMFLKSKAADPTLDFKISDNGEESEDTINSNACYYPDTHRVKIFLDNLFNTVFTNFTLKRIHPNDLTACIVAHELGHSDFEARKVLNEAYAENVDTINKLGSFLTENINRIEKSKVPSVELVKETIDIALERVNALKTHYDTVMQSEMDAFIYGLKYLDNDNLKRLAQENNYQTYTSYLKSELKPLRHAQTQYYMLKRFLDILCKPL